MRSIKTKLIVNFSILSLFSSIVLGFLSIERATQSLTEDAEKALHSLAVEAARVTESRIETQKKTLEMQTVKIEGAISNKTASSIFFMC